MEKKLYTLCLEKIDTKLKKEKDALHTLILKGRIKREFKDSVKGRRLQ